MKKWLSRFFKKKDVEQPREEQLDYMGYNVIDETTGMTLSVLMVCGCGEPVVRLSGEADEGSFYCPHCDRPCNNKPCELCEAHFMFDAEAIKAEAQAFSYEEDEEDE